MMSRSSTRNSYVAKRPLMTITHCRNLMSSNPLDCTQLFSHHFKECHRSSSFLCSSSNVRVDARVHLANKSWNQASLNTATQI